MNAVIDAGNTIIKLGIFDKDILIERHSFNTILELNSFISHISIENVILSSVIEKSDRIISFHVSGEKIILSPQLFLPVHNLYSTPATLGADRIAGACGAWLLYPDQPSLVIDIGTCINYEFVNKKGEYMGGAISPGVKMRFESMHYFTAKLPIAPPVENATLIGDSTIGCLQTGVMNGILEEIKGIIDRYQTAHPTPQVILSGGDAHFFENHLNTSIFVAPELVLMGLNSILLYNVKS